MAETHNPMPIAAAWELLDEEVVRLTSELIRIDTTNSGGGHGAERPAAEYVAEQLSDVGIEPTVLESAPHRANVVARIPGERPDLPAILVHGHLDVVPADARNWSVHPFSGEVRDGVVWGRGAIDMKDGNAKITALARMWARTGTRPSRDVVLAFTADEEDTGTYGAQWLVKEHGDLFEGCATGISESGGYTVHAQRADGTPVRIYPVGVAERGSAWLRLTARGRAGHGSRPNPENAVSMVARTVARISEHHWPLALTPAARASLTEICAALGVDPGFAADGSLSEAEAERVLTEIGPAERMLRPVLRNSSNPTMLDAGYKLNVIPEFATAGIDGRVVPGGRQDFEAKIDELVGPGVEWEYASDSPAIAAPIDAPELAAIRSAIQAHDPDGVVVPVCLSGGTDAKDFSALGIAGFGFNPLRLPDGFPYGTLAHGVDERVPVDALRFGARAIDSFLRSPRLT